MQTETLNRSPRSEAPTSTTTGFQPELRDRLSDTTSRANIVDTTDSSRPQFEGKAGSPNSVLDSRAEPVAAESSSTIQREEVNSQSREAAEVAAAARFISQIDNVRSDVIADPTSHFAQKPRLGSSTNVRDSILDTTINISKLRLAKSHNQVATKRGRTTRPPPLDLHDKTVPAEEVQTPLPERISSKGAPSFDFVRSVDSADPLQDQTLSPNQDTGFKSPLPVLTPESATTFQFDFDIPTEPRLSRSESAASTISQSPPTPATGPSDDQVRKDIEAFALEQGPHLRGSQRRARRHPAIDISEQKNEADTPLPQMEDADVVVSTPIAESTHDADASREINDATQPVLRRKKSIFGWLQKKQEVEVDDLIDLYLTDAQLEEVKMIKSKSSKPKLPIFRSRNATDPLPFRAS